MQTAQKRAILIIFFLGLFAASCGATTVEMTQVAETTELVEMTAAPVEISVTPQALPSATRTANPPTPTAFPSATPLALPSATSSPSALPNTGGGPGGDATPTPAAALSSPTAAYFIVTPLAGNITLVPIYPLVSPVSPVITPFASPTAGIIPVTGGGEATATAMPAIEIPATPDAVALVEQQMLEVDSMLTSGRLGYNPPKEMIVGQKVIIKAGILPLIGEEPSAPAADATLSVELNIAPEELKAVTISTSLAMIMELKGDETAFEIRPLHTEGRQIVAGDQVTEWAWEVTPLKPGSYQLTLTASAVVEAGGESGTRSKTYQDDISVRVDPAITVPYLLNRYWLPLLVVALLVVGTGSFITIRQVRFRKQKKALMAILNEKDPEKGKGYVFISYSHKDERFVIPLVGDLRQHGIRAWIDQREITSGEDWREEIKIGLQNTDAVLVVLSPNSMASKFVLEEVAAAQKEGKPIFPILQKKAELPPNISALDFVDFTKDYETALEEFVRDLNQAGFVQEEAS